MTIILQILGFFFACFAGYYSFDLLRSALTGTHLRGANSPGNPRAFKTRVDRAIGGVVAGALALAALLASIFGTVWF
jgi:hypothetical protein